MKRFLAIAAVGCLIVAAAGCNKSASDQRAVRQAIEKHLAGLRTINMAAMDTIIGQITVNGDQAQANVDFRLKENGTTMQITYALERHGGDWIVLQSKPAGGGFSHPPMDQTHSGLNPNPGDSAHPTVPTISDFFPNGPPPPGHPPAQHP